MPVNKKRDLKPAYSRILKGIGLMGYSGPAALMDIIDNSIEAHASEISVYFETDEALKTKSRLSAIVIADNGDGMNLDEMYNALQLGSPASENYYAHNSLSKFGFGLKSAGFSVAKTIKLISRKEEGEEWKKSYIDYEDILKTDEWNIYEDEPVEDKEKKYLEKYKKGTIVVLERMQHIFTDKKSSTFIRHISEEAALTFGSLLENIRILIDENEIKPDDPLYWDEAKKIIEDYDGKKPCRFMEEPIPAPIGTITVGKKKVNVGAIIRAVQLPNLHAYTSSEWPDAKSYYRMTAEREGIYIYRNNRLISKHSTMGFFNKNDTDYMSLRIRIDVDSDADDLVSLDVKKQTIQFSDSAMKEIANIVKPIIKQSKAIWNEMKNRGSDAKKKPLREEEERHKRSNIELANKFDAVTNPEDNSVTSVKPSLDELPELEKKYGISGKLTHELSKKNISKITNVAYIDKNMLWEPAYSSEVGPIVVLSRQHPFYDRVYSKLNPESDEVVILDALFLALASAEQNILFLDKAKEETFVKLFRKYRATVSQNLETFLDFDFEEDEEDIENEE